MLGKIMLIDGNSIANRAFYGVPLLTNNEGTYTNAVYGFFNIILKFMDEEKPTNMAVAFDLKAPTFRHKKYTDYKGTRKKMPDELFMQMPIIKKLLTLMNIKQYAVEGFEADDIIGTLSKQAVDMDYEAVIVSGDRDLLQLAGETVKIKMPKTKGGNTETEEYYAKDVFEKYGVSPKEFIEVKALMGDSSDNIPGVPSIGEKTAIKIIQKYGTVENAIKNASEISPAKASKNITEFEEQARLSRFLVEITKEAPVTLELENMPVISSSINGEAYDILKKLELKSLLGRFNTNGSATEKNKEKAIYRFIKDKTEFDEYLKSVKDCKNTAYVIISEDEKPLGLSFYNENGGTYAEMASDVLMKSSECFFEDENIKKTGHNIKHDIRLLSLYGIELKGADFDTSIAGYILNSTRESYDYDDIASEFLGRFVKSEEEILGKGKSKASVKTLDENSRVSFAVTQSEIMYEGRKVMEEKIEESGQHELFYDIEMPLIYVLSDMEKYGMKVDKSGLEQYGSYLEEKIVSIRDEIYKLAGEEFNINSPKQLGYILFEKMGLKGSKKTKTGYSTAASVLEKLRYENPIVEKVLYFRQLSKLKSTYADGLLAVMDKNTHRIYSTFNQTVTATGRISSTEPNLQNIPVRLELGRELRKVFIPEDGYIFVDADYSQIELRVLAHMADDEALQQAFINGQDIHRLTASQVLGKKFEDITDYERRQAKAVNFGIIYGIGAFSLSQDLGITRKAAEQYIESYFKKYPNVKKYMTQTVEKAKKDGYVSTIFNRRRPMPELSASNFVQRSFGERVAMNMPIQGTAADIIKIAMVKVWRELKKRKMKSRLILQVHDELIIEAPENEKEEAAKILQTNMENAVKLKVPLVAEVKNGYSWYDAK
ncbi:MAG: DNA polymerase I [Clostridia bacterium]|jgi:DNA polymerase-1|nr:DNA polymerase I [Clostridia bacterium]MCI2000239.1 DNA polymerase I [Clostridia bacterium]MCI2014596.1 DNA polymerase I [Clostridia bacterium]